MDDLRNRSARVVFEDHLRTAAEWSFEDDIKRNFSKDCVVLIKDGIYRGHDGLIELANRLRQEIPGATFNYTTQLVEGEAAFLEWSARSESFRVDDGVDSFFIRDGLIIAQTIHYTRLSAPLPKRFMNKAVRSSVPTAAADAPAHRAGS